MNLPKRKLPRLTGYDYSTENFYFVTVCTHEKRLLFGKPSALNLYGRIAEEQMLLLPSHYEDITVDKFVIMPNHIHAIIAIGCKPNVGNGLDHSENTGATVELQAERSRPFPTLSTIIGLYKSGVARQIRKIQPKAVVWQKSFHDHIIRNENDYEMIWQYIYTNPLMWEKDCFYTTETD